MSHTALFSHCKKDKIVVYKLILHDSKQTHSEHSQGYYYKSLFAGVIMGVMIVMIMPSFLYTVYLAPK